MLIENVRHHVEEEEGEFFPKVRNELGRKALADLGEALAKPKSAPTHPHPRRPTPARTVGGDRRRDRPGQRQRQRRRPRQRQRSPGPDRPHVAQQQAEGLADRVDGGPQPGEGGPPDRFNGNRGAEQTARSVRTGAAKTGQTARSGAKATATTAKKSARATRSSAKRAATTTGRTARAASKRSARRPSVQPRRQRLPQPGPADRPAPPVRYPGGPTRSAEPASGGQPITGLQVEHAIVANWSLRSPVSRSTSHPDREWRRSDLGSIYDVLCRDSGPRRPRGIG